MIGRFGFVDDRAHAVLCFVAVADLNLVAVLQIYPAVAALVHDEKFDVQAEISIRLLRDDVRRTVFAACCGRVIRHEHSSFVDRIIDDLPLDRAARKRKRGPVQ